MWEGRYVGGAKLIAAYLPIYKVDVSHSHLGIPLEVDILSG